MKRLILMLALFAGLACLASAATDPTKDRQIRAAMKNIPALVEFGQLYTNGFYVLKHENGRDMLEVRTLISPCYEIIMRVPVHPFDDGNPLVQMMPAEVELWKIEQVRRDEGGMLVVDRAYPQYLINQFDWTRLYKAKGDFSAIGITLIPGIEIQGLRDYRDKLRKEAHVGW